MDGDVMKSNLNLKYCILPAANPAPKHVDSHNKAFSFWFDSLKDAFAETGNDPSSLIDDFIRQDLATVIFAGDEAVASLLLSFYSIDSLVARKFRYLGDTYPEIYFEKLKKHGVHSVMSMQYLTVHPNWRKSKCEFHFAPTIFALAQNIQRAFGVDAIISCVRRDNKVNELVYSLGGECIIANVDNQDRKSTRLNSSH